MSKAEQGASRYSAEGEVGRAATGVRNEPASQREPSHLEDADVLRECDRNANERFLMLDALECAR